jgi:maleylacetate reductase
MSWQGTYNTFAIERVVYGRPAAEVVKDEVERIGGRRIFLMVSRTLRSQTNWIQQLTDVLGDRCACLHDGIPAHTPRESVLEATASARAARTDLVVTFGGGSLTDAGKMVRLALRHDVRDVAAFDRFVVRANRDGTRTSPQYEAPDVPQIVVPTTLSGGEYNLSAGATDTRTGLKEIFRHPALVPRAVVLDPSVTLATPEWLWLSTGIRALDHAVETVCAPQANPRSYFDSLQAIRLLAQALPRTKQYPDDLDARTAAQSAVWLAMEHNRFGIPMGASHGIGHVLGGTCGVPHGYTSCVMLAPVLRFNAPANGDRQRLVAEAMGRPNEPAWEAVRDLVAGLGMPGALSEVGVRPEHYQTIAEAAMLDHYVHTNPRRLQTVADIIDLLRQAEGLQEPSRGDQV